MSKRKNPQTREDVLDIAIEDIRGKFGDGAIMRLGESYKAEVEVISTGILPLDAALGIRAPKGGASWRSSAPGSGRPPWPSTPRRPEGGGIAAFIDAEHALDPNRRQPRRGHQALYRPSPTAANRPSTYWTPWCGAVP